MSRRTALPGADELFRSTGRPLEDRTEAGAPAPPAVARLAPVADPQHDDADDLPLEPSAAAPVRARATSSRRRARPVVDRRPTGRERHDEKITVYVSADELLDLEHARLTLRGDHGLAVDRGRIVREALAVVLADLDAKGETSILVRRLRGL
jgi:hypothetical protein